MSKNNDEKKFPAIWNRKVSSRIDDYPEMAYVVNNKKDDNRIFVFYKVLDNIIKSLNGRFDQVAKWWHYWH